jgi:4'-phosphopantetheinyl transferase
MSAGWVTGPNRATAPAAAIDVWRADLGRVGPRERRPAARRALRRVLARYLGQDPDRIELSGGERGKPAIAGPCPPLCFNLSHSGTLALVAVTREREVGVDVERADETRDVLRLAEVGLDAPAAAAVRAAAGAERPAAFYSAWVRKEAVAKCHGVGLGAPLPRAPVQVFGLEVAPGYAAAVAVAGATQLPLRAFALP